jgi:anti-sigma factor RsiW
VDGELSPEQAADVSAHLSSCAECAREYEATLATVRAVREGLVRHHAPDVLRARVRAAIREERPEEAATPAVERSRQRRSPSWSAAAAAILIAVASSGLTLVVTGGRHAAAVAEPAVAGEVLASHIRSLMPDHLTDVRSSDQHNVKPWFNGRLDFSPSVPRLDEQGFPLLGGRLDYVAGRPVAVLVYGRRQHVINVYTWPTAGGDAGVSSVASVASHGYHALHWRAAGAEHWAVSDLNVAELGQFADLWRQAAR